MNCVGVTCLSIVCPAGNLNSFPPYFAETSFQVPISLLSVFASFFSSARAVGTASATITARQSVALLNIGHSPRGNTKGGLAEPGTVGWMLPPPTNRVNDPDPLLGSRD